jgi:hypothetical protein
MIYIKQALILYVINTRFPQDLFPRFHSSKNPRKGKRQGLDQGLVLWQNRILWPGKEMTGIRAFLQQLKTVEKLFVPFFEMLKCF